jgi:hypothetical protein
MVSTAGCRMRQLARCWQPFDDKEDGRGMHTTQQPDQLLIEK